MKSFRENPDGAENQQATRENEAYVKSLQRQIPVCDCGNIYASWHGKRNGHRVFCCDKCWSECWLNNNTDL